MRRGPDSVLDGILRELARPRIEAHVKIRTLDPFQRLVVRPADPGERGVEPGFLVRHGISGRARVVRAVGHEALVVHVVAVKLRVRCRQDVELVAGEQLDSRVRPSRVEPAHDIRRAPSGVRLIGRTV